MSREWKPGEVALWHGAFSPYVALYVGDECANAEHEPGHHWHLSNGGWSSRNTKSIRRALVVIDPEDRDAVERLTASIYDAATDRPYVGGAADGVQAALREFADPKPPKPAEPTGLGAVVEDAEGRLWIRTCQPCDDCLKKPWQSGALHCHWQIVAAVRVLSEGIDA